ncbi:MAG: hypothetical protein M5U31_03340 [Acidimicrobiia bacterium]|nr:hypothetical protein [Acidimicrobiia bacterium]
MTALLITASEEIGERTLWNPTLKGVLVVACAIGLFCGSVYLLLGTNLGARLGFLVAAAGLSGFMVLLSLLWLTNTDPLGTLKGRIPEWHGVEVVEEPAEAEAAAVQTIETDGTEVPEGDRSDLTAAAEVALTGEESELATFTSSADYLVVDAFEVGGEKDNLLWHVPHYAAVVVCPVDTAALEVPVGDPIPEPECKVGEATQTLVLLRDLGSIRQPPWIVFGASSIFFILCLLSMHWREQDLLRQREEAELATTDATDDHQPEPVG